MSLDATVGQSLVLPCEVSSDSSLNPNFKWFFNGKAIDFNRQEHFERIGAVCIMWVNLWCLWPNKISAMDLTRADTEVSESCCSPSSFFKMVLKPGVL